MMIKAGYDPLYSETCEIRTPLGRAKSAPNSEVSSFHRAMCTENSSLGQDEVSLFHRMSSFRRVAIHRFHCSIDESQVAELFLLPTISWDNDFKDILFLPKDTFLFILEVLFRGTVG
jgi:hypothetical protein